MKEDNVASETILLIEDDPDILELVKYNLEREGYKVLFATDGEQGLRLASAADPSLVVLDIMLPGIDGLTVCRKLRQNAATANVPILMLTAKGEESDIVIGLELGADDYVSKPFSPKELVARIRALLRRRESDREANSSATVKDEKVQAGPVTIDSERHEVFLNGAPLALTLAEFRLLQTLTSRPGRVFTRDQLLEKITGGDAVVIDRNVDVHIRAIRKKLGHESEMILTVRGVGYKCRE
jgi:DNA-binding response OmpR family regulator